MSYHITFPPQSNRASWIFVAQFTDFDNDPIDLSNCSLVFAIRSPRRDGDGYGFHPGEALIASTENGKLTIIDIGKFQWFFTLQDMRNLRPGTYDTGLTLTNDDGTQTVQLSVGPLPIFDGVVP
jgi:hypothetical protein